MSVLILVPAVICLFFVMWGRMDIAFLSVYLPTAFLLPQTYRYVSLTYRSYLFLRSA
jgi:hypothetical protein